MQMAVLTFFIATNSLTLSALFVLLARNFWLLGGNTTTIEGWEIERHESLVRRSKKNGGYLEGPNGVQLRVTKQEFPYDIGIFRNFQQALGRNPLLWLWPCALTPKNASGLAFETNGFEGGHLHAKLFCDNHSLIYEVDPNSCWPPPDPDKIPRQRGTPYTKSFIFDGNSVSNQDYVEAFRKRQSQDLGRLNNKRHGAHRPSNNPVDRPSFNSDRDQKQKVLWKNSEGESLHDFGVDEEAERCDEDNLTLSELLRWRRSQAYSPENSK